MHVTVCTRVHGALLYYVPLRDQSLLNVYSVSPFLTVLMIATLTPLYTYDTQRVHLKGSDDDDTLQREEATQQTSREAAIVRLFRIRPRAESMINQLFPNFKAIG
jgi:hypothetical protein